MTGRRLCIGVEATDQGSRQPPQHGALQVRRRLAS